MVLLQCYIALVQPCRLVLECYLPERQGLVYCLSHNVTHGSGTPYIRDSITPYDGVDYNDDDDEHGDADVGVHGMDECNDDDNLG